MTDSPSQLRQHAIDDQHVVLAVERHRQALLAVGRLIGDMADLAECLHQIIGGVAVVFDDEKAHGGVSPNWQINLDRDGGLITDEVVSHGSPGKRLAEKVRGRQAPARHPLDRLHPGGGDGCREAELVFGGDGPYGPSPRVRPPAGATDAGGSPHYSRAMGSMH